MELTPRKDFLEERIGFYKNYLVICMQKNHSTCEIIEYSSKLAEALKELEAIERLKEYQ